MVTFIIRDRIWYIISFLESYVEYTEHKTNSHKNKWLCIRCHIYSALILFGTTLGPLFPNGVDGVDSFRAKLFSL